MSCDKCEEALALARAERDLWWAEALRLRDEKAQLATAIEELHYLIDPHWDDE